MLSSRRPHRCIGTSRSTALSTAATSRDNMAEQTKTTVRTVMQSTKPRFLVLVGQAANIIHAGRCTPFALEFLSDPKKELRYPVASASVAMPTEQRRYDATG